MVWDCKWAKFVYTQQLWPLIDVKMLFPDSNSSSVVFDRFSSILAWTLISERDGLGLQMG